MTIKEFMDRVNLEYKEDAHKVRLIEAFLRSFEKDKPKECQSEKTRKKIIDSIEMRGGSMTQRELMQVVRLKSSFLQIHLSHLIEKRIIEIETLKSGKGKKTILIKLRPNSDWCL